MESARLAVARLSALGDIAAAIPVLRAFEVPICVITSPLGYELLGDEFDEFVILEKKDLFSMVSMLWELKKKRFDTLVDLQNNDRSRLIRMLFRRVCTNRGVEPLQPVTKIFYDIALKSGRVAPLDYSFVKKDRSYIVLNAGSSPKWLSKRVPFGIWRQIGEKLYDRFALPFVLTGDRSEREYLDALAGHLPAPAENLAGKTSIRELKSLLKNAYLTVSTDSASMHISAVSATPTIGIFGATNWIRSAPFGPWSTVLYDRTLYPDGQPPARSIAEPGNYYEHLDLEAALETIKEYL